MSVLKAGAVKGLAHENFPSFLRQYENVLILDKWQRGEQRTADEHDLHEITGIPYQPKDTGDEYKQLSKLSPNPVGMVLVTGLGQTLFVEGVRRAGSTENMQVWETWRRNGWNAKQNALYRDSIGHGVAYGTAGPGKDPLTGDRRSKMSAYSAKRMAAFYEDPNDEWPIFGIKAEKVIEETGFNSKWTVTVYDEEARYFLSCENNGRELEDWTYISFEEHGMGVTPIVRYANRLDLEGRATGELEPILPMLARVDQTTFDRLIVQRFGAWKVRYIAGLAKPDSTTDKVAQALRLRIEDLLISTNPETKFGTLDSTDLKQFLEVDDHDLRMIAAVSQMPPHHLLGLSSNLQAEALAAATEGLMRKSLDYKVLNGEAHEQMFRLVATADGNREEARATDMKVRWRDTESRSLVQTANALSLLATGLKIPVEMLWERLPDWSDDDTERAKTLVESGAFEKLVGELEAEVAANAAKTMAEAVPPEPKATGGSDNTSKKG